MHCCCCLLPDCFAMHLPTPPPCKQYVLLKHSSQEHQRVPHPLPACCPQQAQ